VTERKGRWALRLLALASALIVWFFTSVEKRERISEKVVDASVTYNLPRGAILLDPVQTVKVRLRGPDRQLRSVAPYSVNVVVDVGAVESGRLEVVHLAAADVSVPGGEVDVLSVEPNTLPVRVDLEVTRVLPVLPRIVGEPAASAVVGNAVVIPDNAVVRGPKSLVASLDSLITSPVSLDGHAFTFDQTVSVLPPDPLVRIVQPSAVTVRVPMHNPDSDQAEVEGDDGGERPRRPPS
jgi:YbbR domain-containing protein